MGKKYVDERGYYYRVMVSISQPPRYTTYCRECKSLWGWQVVEELPWRLTEEDAQSDLDQLAARKGWTEWEG